MPDHDDYDYDRPDDRRRDDGYDDHGREDYEDHEDPERGSRSARVRRARERVSLPAIFLIILGLLSLFAAVTILALVWINPDVMLRSQYDMMKDMFPNQPLPAYEEWVKQQQITATLFNALRIVMSILMTVGAMKMRSLEGYGLAMTASIIAIIPLCPNECCCATPFGIWAVVVLVNADVKRAFSIVARGGS
jgi:uncharacterized membrane protein HdeD (DUF308 family)